MRTGQDRAGQGGAGQGRAEQDRGDDIACTRPAEDPEHKRATSEQRQQSDWDRAGMR